MSNPYRGLATIALVGYQGWLPGLVTRVGYQGWLPGLVTRVGFRVGWLVALVGYNQGNPWLPGQ